MIAVDILVKRSSIALVVTLAVDAPRLRDSIADLDVRIRRVAPRLQA